MTIAEPIPCSKPDCSISGPVMPGWRGVVLTAETAYHRECLLDYATAPLGPLTRRVLRQLEWAAGRCRMGGAA